MMASGTPGAVFPQRRVDAAPSACNKLTLERKTWVSRRFVLDSCIARPLLVALLFFAALASPLFAQEEEATEATTDDAAATAPAADPPPLGSQVPPDENYCAMCHGESDLWDEKARRLFISSEHLAVDAHYLKGVNCHDCHGGDHSSQAVNEAHATDSGFRPLAEVRNICAKCHQNPELELHKGVHAKAGAKDPQGQGTTLQCSQCHGGDMHRLLPAVNAESPLSVENQVKTCGHCHDKYQKSYLDGIHGHALVDAGLKATASCTACHGTHGIYWAADKRSTLHAANVAATCGACHQKIAERIAQSVHGPQAISARQAGAATASSRPRQAPTCTSCHEGHQRRFVDADRYRIGLPNLCSNCHAEESGSYAMAIHSELTEVGYVPAANCAECHGAHDMQSLASSESPAAHALRVQSCRQCHPAAPERLFSFSPHADHRSRRAGSSLHEIYAGFMTVLVVVFGVLGVHALLWFVRSLVDVLRHGRRAPLTPGGIAYRRYSGTNRWAYTALVTSFLGLALTGLPLKYSHHNWAVSLSYALGGFQAVGKWHRLFALLAFACSLVAVGALVSALYRGWRRGDAWSSLFFGPDSLLFRGRDFRDAWNMVRYFFGQGPKPTFERWGYWEKFDFWGAWVAIVIIGGTGFILWFPQLFSLAFPGSLLNAAKVIHSTQALLAVGLLFAIHFFNTHLRAEQFPGDVSVMTGLVGEQRLAEERPEYLRRLADEGRLEQHRVVAPSRAVLRSVRLGGLLATLMGLFLLVGTLIAAME